MPSKSRPERMFIGSRVPNKRHGNFKKTESLKDVSDTIETKTQSEEKWPTLYACSVCKKIFTSKNHMVRHERVHFTPKMFKCSKCTKSFNYKNELIVHTRTHTMERPFQCEKCGKTFTDGSWFSRHKISHTGERKYLCEICGKLFLTAGALQVHRNAVHLSIRSSSIQQRCRVCRINFASKRDWDQHLEIYSTHNMPLACPHCDRRFKYHFSLQYHITVHTGEKPFACKVCGKTFRSSNNIKEHIRVHHTKMSERLKHKCRKCNKTFLNRKTLREHPCIDRFRCWSCKKYFTSESELALHKDNHTGEEKRFECVKCGKKYSTKYYLLNLHKCETRPVLVVVERPPAVANHKSEEGNINLSRTHEEFNNLEEKVGSGRNTMKTEQRHRDTTIENIKRDPTSQEPPLFPITASNTCPVRYAQSVESAREISIVADNRVPSNIVEIKQEMNESLQSRQDMTYIFKIDGPEIILLRP